MGRKPNILFFFTDQQRWDTCGCYGQPLDITPNLDRMAAEGVRFEKAFTCQPVCAPARACIQTGRYATETGVWRNHREMPLTERTIAHWLSEAGYEVGYIGKWHLASDDRRQTFFTKPIPPERRWGYKDYWLAADVLEFTSHSYEGHMFDADMQRVDFKGYRVDCLTDFALDYLRTRDLKKPFFLFLSYIEPHHQNNHHRYEGPMGSRERFKNFVVPGDLVGTAGDWRKNYPDYLGCINSLDYNLGRIRSELDKLGLADDTLIIFTTDHGSTFCTRNSEYKRSCHDGCCRIPMVFCGPGFRGGKVFKELASLIDIAPTLLAAGSVGKPSYMRGRPLQELVLGTATDWPGDVFIQISEEQLGRAIRTDKWKYCVAVPGAKAWVVSNSDYYVEDSLYDLDNDPWERQNLVKDPLYSMVREKLRGILIKRIVEAGEKEPRIEPAT